VGVKNLLDREAESFYLGFAGGMSMDKSEGDRKGEELLTTGEAASYLKVNRRTIYRLLRARKIPALRVGGQWRFRRRDLDEWLEAKKVKPEGGRVLVVDDEPQICGFISEILNEEGYRVDAAYNGDEAFQLLQRRDYDLVFVDIVMPRMSGLELISKVRKAYPEMKFVVITGNASLENAIEAANLGVSGYLQKPLSVGKITEITKGLLGWG